MSFLPYDIVILGGWVMDPETNFEGVCNVGISNGKIVTITEKSLSGKETIQANGLVVCPGFIEGHVHGMDVVSQRRIGSLQTTVVRSRTGFGNTYRQ